MDQKEERPLCSNPIQDYCVMWNYMKMSGCSDRKWRRIQVKRFRAADITWDYKKVKWDSIGITEKLLGLQSGSQKKGHKVVWDSRGILEGF